jgi:hypothetical protein
MVAASANYAQTGPYIQTSTVPSDCLRRRRRETPTKLFAPNGGIQAERCEVQRQDRKQPPTPTTRGFGTSMFKSYLCRGIRICRPQCVGRRGRICSGARRTAAFWEAQAAIVRGRP